MYSESHINIISRGFVGFIHFFFFFFLFLTLLSQYWFKTVFQVVDFHATPCSEQRSTFRSLYQFAKRSHSIINVCAWTFPAVNVTITTAHPLGLQIKKKSTLRLHEPWKRYKLYSPAKISSDSNIQRRYILINMWDSFPSIQTKNNP